LEYVVAVLVGFVLAQLAGLITTVYLHQVLAHKAIRLHPAVTMAMRLGTWALNRDACTPAKTRVPLSGKGLRDAAPDALGVSFDCATPRRVLVGVRAIANSAPVRYREQAFEKTKVSLQSAYLAVRTRAGKQLAFAAVFDTGRAQLRVARSCRED